jgi:hypothetical protein
MASKNRLGPVKMRPRAEDRWATRPTNNFGASRRPSKNYVAVQLGTASELLGASKERQSLGHTQSAP